MKNLRPGLEPSLSVAQDLSNRAKRAELHRATDEAAAAHKAKVNEHYPVRTTNDASWFAWQLDGENRQWLDATQKMASRLARYYNDPPEVIAARREILVAYS